MNLSNGPRLVVENDPSLDRGLTDAVLANMSDDALHRIVCDADAPMGDRVRAQFERQRRDVYNGDPLAHLTREADSTVSRIVTGVAAGILLWVAIGGVYWFFN